MPEWLFESAPDFSVGQAVKIHGRDARVVSFAWDNDVRVRFADGREELYPANEVE